MSQAHARPQNAKKRMFWIGLISAGALTAGAVAALAAGNSGNSGTGAAQSIACPDPTGAIPAVPAQAQAEVTRELQNLQNQINEANKRLVDTVGQGGPNFVQNAILGPLEDKRVAALNRIETAIGRAAAKPEGLERFAPCALGQAPAVSNPPATSSSNGNGSGGNSGGGQASGKIVCPDPTGAIPAVPAQAQAEVTRELQNLQKQINEANKRLVDTAGQGGPNFVQNAILGPLADKRVAALNRIETAIGRAAAKPEGLERFAPCALGQAPAVTNPPAAGGGMGSGNNGNSGGNNSGNNGGGQAVGRISCPDPTGAIPAVPAQAQAEVTRELQGLQNQINEANNRLVSTVGQGGPNFVQNAILGPLADKRTAALNRIETAIGRFAAKPEGLERFATCQVG
ncbi:regulator of protease activity HflC (stomatin/prohibitin superfamily) [Kibdelosporangium banguiense]|uniref:Regulator of protease activity HflC (Stomatin/prohibitin superfamily) n=1 Tax=Kibdelosporangium banguiense TaxID=1365924 RepID=A0ABS4TSS5_9PSEU|nr:hypothetical protein [Kibdelosporangium banguiense]MBP2327451.1 regulator of protease activity HflC (stomatin/prohibitin superfamily) [Kibdelosporangium banguiense]